MGCKRIEIDLAQVEHYAQICDNQEEIARALGISERTITNRLRDDAEFSAAYKRGKAKANVFVGGKLMDLIRNGNVAATIFYLKARAGWRDNDKPESAAPPVNLVIVNDLPPDD